MLSLKVCVSNSKPMHRKKETWDTSLNENRSLNTNSFVVLVSNTWGNPMLMPCAVCKKTIINPCTNISSKINVWNEIFTIRYLHRNITYLIAILINTDIVAIPRPLPETRIISTNSLFRLKYCPIIRVAGSRVMATPIPTK